MTNYTITYRADDGSIATTTLEAADRAACVAACRARGITPVSIKEGQTSKAKGQASKPRNSETSKPRNPETSKPRNLQVFVLALLALVAIGAAVWFFFLRTPTEHVPEGKDSKPSVKVVKEPKPVRQPKSTPIPVTTNISSNVVAAKENSEEWNGQKVIAKTVRTNDNGSVVQILKTVDGKTHRITTPKPPVFDNASDQIIAMAVSGLNNDSMAPMPLSASTDADFRKSLERPIIIAETDSEEVKTMKQAVIDVRAQLKKVLDEGGSVRDALAEHQRLVNENGKVRAGVQKELQAYLEKGDLQGARSYLSTMNKMLNEMGINSVTLPPTPQERAARVKEMKQSQIKENENEN